MSVTLPLLAPPPRPWSPVWALPWVPAVIGVAALLARPWFLPAGVQVEWRVAFFTALGLVGVAWPLSRHLDRPRAGISVSIGVLALGAAGFALGRAVVDVPVGPSALATAIALNGLAAVAEEAFFRRYLYGLLDARWGTGVAVAATAVLFALVHVTVWGWWVLPLALAAGLLLSWQRAATGRWSVPAATHVLANTLAFL